MNELAPHEFCRARWATDGKKVPCKRDDGLCDYCPVAHALGFLPPPAKTTKTQGEPYREAAERICR